MKTPKPDTAVAFLKRARSFLHEGASLTLFHGGPEKLTKSKILPGIHLGTRGQAVHIGKNRRQGNYFVMEMQVDVTGAKRVDDAYSWDRPNGLLTWAMSVGLLTPKQKENLVDAYGFGPLGERNIQLSAKIAKQISQLSGVAVVVYLNTSEDDDKKKDSYFVLDPKRIKKITRTLQYVNNKEVK